MKQRMNRMWAQFGLVISLAALIAVGVACAGSKPKTFVVTFDQSTNWRLIEVRPELISDSNRVWQTMVDTIGEKYDLEVIQKDSGYLRSGWKHTHIVRGELSEKYRSRVTVKVDDQTKVKIRLESQWMSDNGWLTGYDTALLDDIYSDLHGKIGRIVK